MNKIGGGIDLYDLIHISKYLIKKNVHLESISNTISKITGDMQTKIIFSLGGATEYSILTYPYLSDEEICNEVDNFCKKIGYIV